MTREEEIEQEARDNYPYWEDAFISFCRGAHWADEHPKSNLVDIDKVCEWIKEHNGDYISIVPNDHLTNNFYDDLRKAMKGE